MCCTVAEKVRALEGRVTELRRVEINLAEQNLAAQAALDDKVAERSKFVDCHREIEELEARILGLKAEESVWVSKVEAAKREEAEALQRAKMADRHAALQARDMGRAAREGG
jgi:hypothetical protein